MIVPHDYFIWFCTLAVMGLSVVWFIYDSIRLRRFVPKGKEAHDEIFGSIIGLVISTIGIVGGLHYHLG